MGLAQAARRMRRASIDKRQGDLRDRRFENQRYRARSLLILPVWPRVELCRSGGISSHKLNGRTEHRMAKVKFF